MQKKMDLGQQSNEKMKENGAETVALAGASLQIFRVELSNSSCDCIQQLLPHRYSFQKHEEKKPKTRKNNSLKDTPSLDLNKTAVKNGIPDESGMASWQIATVAPLLVDPLLLPSLIKKEKIMDQEEEIKQCQYILDKLKDHPAGSLFVHPSGLTSRSIPYFTSPRKANTHCLSTVERKLESQEYSSPARFNRDIQRIWHLVYCEHQKTTQFYEKALEMQKYHEKLIRQNHLRKEERKQSMKRSETLSEEGQRKCEEIEVGGKTMEDVAIQKKVNFSPNQSVCIN